MGRGTAITMVVDARIARPLSATATAVSALWTSCLLLGACNTPDLRTRPCGGVSRKRSRTGRSAPWTRSRCTGYGASQSWITQGGFEPASRCEGADHGARQAAFGGGAELLRPAGGGADVDRAGRCLIRAVTLAPMTGGGGPSSHPPDGGCRMMVPGIGGP